MPDIAMCLNDTCLSRLSCYRFMAVPSEFWQSYAGFEPPLGDDRCAEFWPIRLGMKLNKESED